MAFSKGMMMTIVALIASTVSASSSYPPPFAGCRGFARYNVTFYNVLTTQRFRSMIPSDGLSFSPLTATGHSNRVSILTVRGFASKAIEAIAETGDNSMLVRALRTLRASKQGVRSYRAASSGVMPGKSVTLMVNVDCMHPFISAVSMIAPSPDWIVQVSNVNMYSRRFRKFMRYRRGNLIAYDAGTDDGREFTAPSDTSLDIPTVPQKNIAPLVEDDTDRFEGRVVGKYLIKRIK